MSEHRKPRPDGIQAVAHGQGEAHETLLQREMAWIRGKGLPLRSTSISTQQVCFQNSTSGPMRESNLPEGQ